MNRVHAKVNQIRERVHKTLINSILDAIKYTRYWMLIKHNSSLVTTNTATATKPAKIRWFISPCHVSVKKTNWKMCGTIFWIRARRIFSSPFCSVEQKFHCAIFHSIRYGTVSMCSVRQEQMQFVQFSRAAPKLIRNA